MSIVPLKGANYATWKVQCRMALVKDGLWNIVNGTETMPEEGDADRRAKFEGRKDRALALIVLSIEPSLLYLIGEPEDPIAVWKKLSEQFQKKTWANKLGLRRRLYAMKLREGGSVQEYIRQMTEIFEELAVVGDPVNEEDRVVHLLASLPESYDMVVTALEANAEVPKMAIVTERLLNQERKQKDREESDDSAKAMTVRSKREIKCYYCKKVGHIKRDCYAFKRRQDSLATDSRPMANTAEDYSQDEEKTDGLVVTHALTTGHTGSWIIDSGAICHMCASKELFVDLKPLEKPMNVTLGDGRTLKAMGRGLISMEMKLPNGVKRKCNLLDVVYVPDLSYNLLSVSRAAEKGYVTEFNDSGCQITATGGRVVAIASRVGSLYYLDCEVTECASVAEQSLRSKAALWHQRYGHLNMQSLQKLLRNKLVEGLDGANLNGLNFCETCVKGKQAKSAFPDGGGCRATEPLDLVHSDVCGKMNSTSLGGGEYFLTFIDDHTRYTWIYILKHKSEVLDCFLKWKALVERSSGRKLRAFRTDNGGEYTSIKFTEYLMSSGIRHEFTVPNTPQQNGVAERMNRTLVETVRSLLVHAKLPHKFWAEALSTAVYLRNRSPTKAVESMTPYEAWTRKKPSVGHLRVFGCHAYSHMSRDERRKLDSKSRKCILVGYGEETKAYRLFDPEHGRVILSRNVVFNEECCGGSGVGGSGVGGSGVGSFGAGGFGVGGFGDAGAGGSGGGGSGAGGSSAGGSGTGGSGVGGTDQYMVLDFDDTQAEFQSEVGDHHDTPQSQSQPQSTIRQSTRRHVPDYYAWEAHLTGSQGREPITLEEAMMSPEKSQWVEAMKKEMKSLYDNEVWELVELPNGRKTVGSKWIFKLKTDEDGGVERFKARLVAQGYTQRYGTDYDETFCPVVRLESIRVLMALSVQHGLHLHQIDVTTAFLNGDLEEEVFMRQPEGFIAKGQTHLVCKLKKSLYGLKQSPRCWNVALDNYLRMVGFIQLDSDPCIYHTSSGEPFFLGVYVDDIVMASKSTAQLAEFKKSLATKFDIKDLGRLHHFLGMKVIQDEAKGNIWFGQQAYTKKLLRRFGMEDAKPVATPVDTSNKLVKATESEECIDQHNYQSAVGSLLYLAVATRPDISFAVSNIAKFSAQPTKTHWVAVKRILRYLKGSVDYGLNFTHESTSECIGYSDADWGGDLDDRKSTSGYVFLISGGAVSWRSKKQSCIALSTAEAEYVALSCAAQEAMWMRRMTAVLQNRPEEPVRLFEDNQAAISMTENPQFHGRSKHISIKYHFVRDQVDKKVVKLSYCPTNDMIADIMTKGLPKEQFLKLRSLTGVKQVTSGSE